jgi:two-component system, OmpR family, KDP operon response regulator KdpE
MVLPKPLRVLIVDDEVAFRNAVHTSLAASGFTVEDAGTGGDAVSAVLERPFDLVLLDINMPGMSGVEACQQIRALAPRMGIIMVTVRDTEEDKVEALEAGADDYVTKPFRLRELIARSGAVLRRRQSNPGEVASILEAGNLKLDLNRRQFWKAREQVALSPTEFELLSFLMKNQGAPLTHAKLLRSVWGAEYAGERASLRVYIRRLREKIEDDPAKPLYIQTESWIGYRFRNPLDPNYSVSAEDE